MADELRLDLGATLLNATEYGGQDVPLARPGVKMSSEEREDLLAWGMHKYGDAAEGSVPRVIELMAHDMVRGVQAAAAEHKRQIAAATARAAIKDPTFEPIVE